MINRKEQLLQQDSTVLWTLVMTLYEEPKLPGTLSYVLWRERTPHTWNALYELIRQHVRDRGFMKSLLTDMNKQEHFPPLVIEE